MKRGRPPRLILSPDPFSVADSENELIAARRNTDCIATWARSLSFDSLQEKGMRGPAFRKNLVAS